MPVKHFLALSIFGINLHTQDSLRWVGVRHCAIERAKRLLAGLRMLVRRLAATGLTLWWGWAVWETPFLLSSLILLREVVGNGGNFAFFLGFLRSW